MPGRPAYEWERIVREFEGSGLSAAEFARLKAVNVSTLSWWRSRFRGRKQLPAAAAVSTGFVELTVTEQPGVSAAGLNLRLDRVGGTLEIPPTVDLERQRQALEAVQIESTSAPSSGPIGPLARARNSATAAAGARSCASVTSVGGRS